MACILKADVQIRDLTFKSSTYTGEKELQCYSDGIYPLAYMKHQWHVKVKNRPTWNITFKGQLRPYQEEAYKIIWPQIMKQNGLLLLHCGWGKTVLGVKIACDLGLETTILVNRLLLKDQWKHAFEQFSTQTPHICMASEVTKQPRKTGLLIVDEARTFCNETGIQALLSVYPKYSIGLTADYTRDDGMHKVMDVFFGGIATRKISRKPFTVYRVNTDFQPQISYMRWNGKLDWNKVLKSLCYNTERNKLLVRIIAQQTAKTLILCRYKDHVNMLRDMLQEKGIEASTFMGTKTTYADARVLIGTKSKMGIGFDEVQLSQDHDGDRLQTILIAFPTKDIEQMIGRVFRSDHPTVYDLVDDFGVLLNHWNLREKWYKARNANIQEVWYKHL